MTRRTSEPQPKQCELADYPIFLAAIRWIVLQKSKVARTRIFRENTKREAIADSSRRNRVAEVACEFNVRR